MRMYILLLLSFFSISMLAGVDGGGGYVVQCKLANGEVTTKLLDLFEGKYNKNYKLINSTGSTELDYINAVKNGYRLQGHKPPVSDGKTLDNLNRFMKVVEWISPPEILPPANDIGPLSAKIPSNCELKQVAYFYDRRGSVSIDKKLWEQMPTLDRAALIEHELVYHHYRRLTLSPVKDSSESRRHVAIRYSTNVQPVNFGLPRDAREKRHFHHNDFGFREATTYFMFEPEEQTTRIQFSHLAGRALLSITTLDLPKNIKLGDVFYIKGDTLENWKAKVIIDNLSSNDVHIAHKLVIVKNDRWLLDIPLYGKN